MPSATVAALTAPIRRVQQLVGPGWSGASDPAAALDGIRAMLVDVAGAAGRAWRHTGADWSGAGADAAADFATSTEAAINAAAERAGGLGVAAADATSAVARAHRRLQHIADEFEVKASALEPHLDAPGVARELLAEARDALTRAIAVVEELSAELDGQAAALEAPATPHAPTGHSSGTPGWSGGAAAGAPAGGAPGLGTALGAAGQGSGIGSASGPAALGDFAAFTRPDDAGTPEAASFGEGVAVRLPDGTVVTAPNAVAAGAVRHALTQLGVPYQWGGTTPGIGLDCSGLTQWAYREAGLDIPRLAQEQDIGGAVAASSVLPGDLVVWDGHVAMIVGGGLMVEAGDPVQLSPIRTANAGQGFQGFWRPTA